MSEITEEAVRAVLEQVADPAFAGWFADYLSARDASLDEAEDPSVRARYGTAAQGLLDELVGSLAAELALREPVTA